MAAQDLTAIDPSLDAGIARIIYEAANDGLDNDLTITYGNKLVLLDTNGTNVEIYVSGTSLVIPATASSTRADTVAFYFGSDSDINMVFDGTKFTVLTPVNDDVLIEWGDGTESFDHKFFFETASNVVEFNASEDMVEFEGVDLRLMDDDILIFGDADDVEITWAVGGGLNFTCVADDSVIKFGDGTESFDIWFYGNTAGDNIIFNASDNIMNFDGIDLQLEDDDILSFGNSKDVTIAWAAGGGLNILAAADDSVITFGATGNSFDIIFTGSTSSKTIEIDTSENEMVFEQMNIRINDKDTLEFGDGKDIEFQWTDAKFTMTALADDKVWEVGDGTESIDLKWFFETASEFVYFDVGSDVVYFTGVDLRLNDDAKLLLGNSSDIEIYWTAAGGMKIAALADDSVIEFGISDATQKSFDVKIYGHAANGVDYALFDAGASQLSFAGAYALELSTYRQTKITNKTASYTVVAADTGTIFTNVGDGDAIEYTLPTEAAGLVYEFYQCEDYEMKITSATGNNIVGFHDKAATDLTFTTPGEHMGAWVKMVCTGTLWLCTYSGGTTGKEYTATFA